MVPDLQFLSADAPIQTEGHKSQIFYFLVHTHGDVTGILDIPRFYGFSREPGMYAVFILPGFLMAHYFNMRPQTIALGSAIIITSSFAGYFVLSILFLIVAMPRKLYDNKVTILIILLLLIILFRHYFYLFGSTRLDDYVLIMDIIIDNYINNIVTFKVGGLLFLLEKLSYLLIVYFYYTKVELIRLRVAFLFLVSFVILLNKANELISPLFLFYLLFIDYLYNSIVINDRCKNCIST